MPSPTNPLIVIPIALACGVALWALARGFLRDAAQGALVLAALLAAPVFLRSNGTWLALGDRTSPFGFDTGQTFPLSVPATAVAFAVLLYLKMRGRASWRWSTLFVPMLIFISLNFLILVRGLRQESHLENVLYFVQTVAPMAVFFVGLQSVRRPEICRRALQICVRVVGWFVTALFGYTILSDGVAGLFRDGLTTLFVVLPIYSAYDYFPLVIAVAYGLALAFSLEPDSTPPPQEHRTSGRRGVRSLKSEMTWLALVLFASLFFLHSKGALATASVIAAVLLGIAGTYRETRARALAMGATCAAMMVFFFVGPPSATVVAFRHLEEGTGARVPTSQGSFPTQSSLPAQSDLPAQGGLPAQRAVPAQGGLLPQQVLPSPAASGKEPSAGADPSLQARTNNVVSAIKTLAAHPLFGLSYVASSVDIRGIRHIASPHDQYLTYGVRGGVLSIALVLWILSGFLVHMLRVWRGPAPPGVRSIAATLFAVFVGVGFVSNLFQDNLVEPYSANLLWYFMGMGESMAVMRLLPLPAGVESGRRSRGVPSSTRSNGAPSEQAIGSN